MLTLLYVLTTAEHRKEAVCRTLRGVQGRVGMKRINAYGHFSLQTDSLSLVQFISGRGASGKF